MAQFNRTAKIYGTLFPAKTAQLDFIQDALPRKVPPLWIDIGCGPGQQVAGLAGRGLDVWGLDVAPEMIKRARAHQPDLRKQLHVGDMRSARKTLRAHIPGPAGVVYCIGNSLALLSRKRDIERAIGSFHALLTPGGNVVIQVVNFDRVFGGDLNFLPRIEKKMPDGSTCMLERSYAFSRHCGCVWFQTQWKSGRKIRKSRHLIRALRKKDLVEMLKANGFGRLKFYGDYQKHKWDRKAGATIVVGTKLLMDNG